MDNVTTPKSPPASAYRLQFNEDFTFTNAVVTQLRVVETRDIPARDTLLTPSTSSFITIPMSTQIGTFKWKTAVCLHRLEQYTINHSPKA